MINKLIPNSYLKVPSVIAQHIGGGLPLRTQDISVTISSSGIKVIWGANADDNPFILIPQGAVVIFESVTYYVHYPSLDVYAGHGTINFYLTLTDNSGIVTNLVVKSKGYSSCATDMTLEGVYNAENTNYLISGSGFKVSCSIYEDSTGVYAASCGGSKLIDVVFSGKMIGFF